MLTIVIPTYKRLANLKVLITHLDQFSAQFDIVIFNNDPDNFLTQKDVIQNQSTRDISIYNTTIHYGADASLLHAMQLVTSEYIYLVGDSKLPNESALDDFVRLSNSVDFDTLVFSFKTNISQPIHLTFERLKNKQIHLGDLFLGGNTIIKTSFFREHFSIATQLTLARSVLLTYNVLAIKEGICLISDKNGIKTFLEKPEAYDPKLSLLECWAQFPLITTLDLTYSQRKILIKKVRQMESKWDLYILIKFSLIQIFREKKDIRYNLALIQKTRALCSVNLFEYSVIRILRTIAALCSIKPSK